MMSKAALLSVLLVAAAAPLASAQPGAQQPLQPPAPTVIIVEPGAPVPGPAPASPAPQNEPWHNVSHINGTPVPVGQRNDYLYAFRRTNLSVNPVAWMFEIYGLSATVALSENVAIHGDITIYGFEDGAMELSVGLPIYLRRTFQGPFLEPGMITRRYNDKDDDDTGPQVLLGWHWMYESGLNLAIAFGAGRDLSKDSDGYSDSTPFPGGYVRIGYAF